MRLIKTLASVSVLLFFCAGCVTAGSGTELKAQGLEYQLMELKTARPNRVHILRVNLDNKKIHPAVVVAADPDGDGPAEAALTDPFTLVSNRPVVAFINSNPWDGFPDSSGKTNRSWVAGQPVNIHGLTVSGGRMRSPVLLDGASVWVDVCGNVTLGDVTKDKPVAEGMAGFQPIVRDGVVVVQPGGPIHPRTAVGLDRTGKILWLVVVDGRQKQFSEGMTLRELGDLMRELGCWQAMNLDGGGSSIMGLAGADGKLHVMNSPSDRRAGVMRIRPLPTILTIERTPER